jgi:hypothetical protein
LEANLAIKLSKEQLVEELAEFFKKHGVMGYDRYRLHPDRPFDIKTLISHFGRFARVKRIVMDRLESESEEVKVKPRATRKDKGTTKKKKEPKKPKQKRLTIPDSTYDFLKTQNERLLQQIAREQRKTKLIAEACCASVEKLNIEPVPPGKRFRAPLDLELHALRGDEHVGEKVDASSTQRVGGYNFGVYKLYLSRWLNKILLFKEQDQATLGLNKLVLIKLGDHVTGEAVYPGQSFYIDRPAVDQIFQSAQLEVEATLTLAQSFEEIEVFCVSGNHGRPGRRGQHHKKTNWDYIYHKVYKQMLVNQENVTVHVSDDPVMIVQHGAFTFLYKHGENIKSWAGIPFYGLERDFSRLAQLYNRMIHFEIVGHRHQPANIRDSIIMNGSFVGGSDLSVNVMAMASRPSQKIFYFDEEHGINRETNLYLAPPVELTPDSRGIFTSYT